ncbi:hypothetical protein QJS10_CPB14g00551 [Acorus calamus]|uniref:Uncharacterized protein n=1 Tax=Acorus calamus TaxID=4465 RepID=A0AAV9D9L6_ACOCL|nr:hypothetical protein QJS10_CPB14g00551 [Acorus calamus]
MDQRENSSAGTDLQNRRELERDLHNKPIKGDREVARPMEELIVKFPPLKKHLYSVKKSKPLKGEMIMKKFSNDN